jgi:hypothetical protein
MRHSLALAMIFVGGCMGGLYDRGVVDDGARANRFKPQPPPVTPESLLVQCQFVERPEGDPAINEMVWRSADEQILSPRFRTELSRNGLRVAKLSAQLGPEMLALLENEKKKDGNSHQVLAGTKVKIEMTPVAPRWNLFTFQDGVPKGENIERAQGFMLATPSLSGAARVHLSLTPDIEFGDETRKFTVGNRLSGLDMLASRPTRVFDDLKIDLDLASGEFLLIGCHPSPKGTLGQLLLTRKNGDAGTQRLLVVRVIRPSREELYQAGYDVNQFFLTPEGDVPKTSPRPHR